MKKLLTHEWMRKCPTCVERVKALVSALEAFPKMGSLRAFEDVRSHLVEEHLALLPDYADDCPNCQEWKVFAANPGDMPSRVIPVLGREDLLHRAGHLLYNTV